MWDCIAGIAARGGLGGAQPWPATAEDRLPRRVWPSATRSVQQGGDLPLRTGATQEPAGEPAPLAH